MRVWISCSRKPQRPAEGEGNFDWLAKEGERVNIMCGLQAHCSGGGVVCLAVPLQVPWGLTRILEELAPEFCKVSRWPVSGCLSCVCSGTARSSLPDGKIYAPTTDHHSWWWFAVFENLPHLKRAPGQGHHVPHWAGAAYSLKGLSSFNINLQGEFFMWLFLSSTPPPAQLFFIFNPPTLINFLYAELHLNLLPQEPNSRHSWLLRLTVNSSSRQSYFFIFEVKVCH